MAMTDLPPTYYEFLARTRSLGPLPHDWPYHTSMGLHSADAMVNAICSARGGRGGRLRHIQMHGDSVVRHLYMSMVAIMRYARVFNATKMADTSDGLYEQILNYSRTFGRGHQKRDPYKIAGFISDAFNHCERKFGCDYSTVVRCPQAGYGQSQPLLLGTRAETFANQFHDPPLDILVIGGSGIQLLHLLPARGIKGYCNLWHGANHHWHTQAYVRRALELTRSHNTTVVFRTTNRVCPERFIDDFESAYHALRNGSYLEQCAADIRSYRNRLETANSSSGCGCSSVVGWFSHRASDLALGAQCPPRGGVPLRPTELDTDVQRSSENWDCLRTSMTYEGSAAMASAERDAVSALRMALPARDARRLKLLDAWQLGSMADYCKFTRTADGRHFIALDALLIRALLDLL